MNVPEEIIKKGSIIIYNDSDSKIINDIIEYNNYMADCRIKMKHIDEIKMAYTVINPLITFGMIAAEANSVFRHPALAISLLAVYSTLFIFFALLKGNFLISTIAAVLLILLDWRFAILFIADIALDMTYEHTKKPLINQPSYPGFNDIQVRYERCNRPIK